MRIAILGGGIGGLSLAWFLAEQGLPGLELEIFEKEERPGGLVRSFTVAGQTFDQHYHCVLVTDQHLRGLIQALGLEHALRFQESQMGFYDGSRILPFNNPLDMLKFPYLTLWEKALLVRTLLYCRTFGSFEQLHQTLLEPWLIGLGGKGAFERVWAPLLASKFDGDFTGIPATYLWSRLRRMQSTRQKGGAVETLGILKGGSSALVQALAAALPARGVKLHLGTPVQAFQPVGREVELTLADGTRHRFDQVISTLASPLHARLGGAGMAPRVAMPDRYLGIVEVVVALRRSLSPYYVLNLLDRSLPFTGVVETTRLLDPEDHPGVHLVYLPRYTAVDGPHYAQSDEAIRTLHLDAFFRMFPEIRREDILDTFVFREPYVEPIHGVGSAHAPFPEALHTAHPQVYLMNTSRLYPELHNCQAVIGLAKRTASFLAERSRHRTHA